MSVKLKQNLLAFLTITVVATLIGCASTGGKTATEQANAKPATETKTGDTKASDTKTSDIIVKNDGGADKIGVAECDDYIAKYEACLTGKVPAASRASFESSIAQMRQSWKQVAANPQAKAALANGCKQARETSKQSMAAYSCEW